MNAWKGSAAAAGLASCHVCLRVSEASEHRCPRCGEALHSRKPFGVQRTMALLIASVLAYIPANLMPVMRVEGVGGGESSTILSGVATFWAMHAYPIAITIFVASILIPILKMLTLAWLCFAVSGRSKMSPRKLTRMYWLTEVVGRWSMVDVFVVAVLVALVQLGNLMSIHPGPAALSFGAVVVMTMLAANSFDPRLIWDRAKEKEEAATGGAEPRVMNAQ
jgi:paraquat-inducible protein A